MHAVLTFAAFALALAGCRDAFSVVEIEGRNGAWSPDGRRIAFQRENADRRFDLGVVDLATGGTTWIERGSGTSAFPAWGKDGSLVYAFAPMTNTSYRSYKAKADVGLNLRVWKDGCVRELTRGWWQDLTPEVSPDGRTVYYASSRFASPPKRERTNHSDILAVPLDGSATPKEVVPAAYTVAGGVTSPAISPDGRFIVWAERVDFFDTWHLVLAPLDDISRMRPICEYGMASSAPDWAPDGRHLFYMGFREGDPGWGVYVQDLLTGASKRLCDGERPKVSPDGRRLLYEDGGRIRIRELGPADLAFAAAAAVPEPWEREGTVHFNAEVELDGDVSKVRNVCWLGPFSGMIVRNGFSVRNYVAFDGPVGCNIFSDRRFGKGRRERVTLTGICDAGQCVWAAVNGSGTRFRIPVDRLRAIPANAEIRAAEGVLGATSGRGWPANVRKPVSRKEVVR